MVLFIFHIAHQMVKSLINGNPFCFYIIACMLLFFSYLAWFAYRYMIDALFLVVR